MAKETQVSVRKGDPKSSAAQAGGEIERRDTTWYRPRVDIFNLEDKVVLAADVPGVTDPDITVSENELVIEAKSQYSEPQDATKVFGEFEPKNYRCAFTLSADIDRDAISASVTDGMLRIEMGKSSQAKVHKIPVKTTSKSEK